MRERIYLNNNWKFAECFTDEMCLETYDAKDMADVRIPHTCKELPLHYFDESLYQMVSGYRKVFTAPTFMWLRLVYAGMSAISVI